MDFIKKPSNEYYYPIKRGHFDKLFEGLSEIFYLFKKEGIWESILDVIELQDSISLNYIKNMVNLICNGACDEYFNYALEFDYIKMISSKDKLSDFELAELVLVKQSLGYLRELNDNSFFYLLNSLCSRELSSKIAPKFMEVFEDFQLAYAYNL